VDVGRALAGVWALFFGTRYSVRRVVALEVEVKFGSFFTADGYCGVAPGWAGWAGGPKDFPAPALFFPLVRLTFLSLCAGPCGSSGIAGAL
jgi:hypothetical protein